MNALQLIWLVSLVLASAATAVMLLLVVARAVTARRAQRRAAERRRLVPILLGGATPAPEMLRDVPTGVVADLSLELIQLVRGDERAVFIESATRLGIPEQLTHRLQSRSHRDRAVAVHALSQFDDEATRAALHRALEDSDQDVRFGAALALVATADPPHAQELIGKLKLGDEQPSLVVVSLLRRIIEDRPDEIKSLVTQPAQSAEIRLAAVEALATSGDYSLVPVIADLALAAQDASRELPRYLRALGKLGHPAAREAVMVGLSHAAAPVRIAAAGAAGRIMLLDSAERLVELLNDPEWWVRFRAAEALILLGEPGLRRLRAVARDGDGSAGEAARAMLAERGLAA